MKISFLPLLGLFSALPVAAQNFTGRLVMGEEIARQQVRTATKGRPAEASSEPLLSTRESAISAAEALAFKRFGRKHILAQRPYETYLIDGFWYITGTLPTGYVGGTFEIILAANDGRVLRLIHGQ